MRSFLIVHKGEEIGVVQASGSRTALARIASDLGLDPDSITGTYRLPVPNDSPVYAVEVQR